MMRIIAIIKKCLECEKKLILSSVEKEDRVLFFDNEKELLKSEDYANIEIVFGEPEYSTIHFMKNLRWIQMTWAGANKYTSASEFPDNIILTSASGAYGCVISEYIVSGILALYKNLFSYRAQMKSGGWNQIEGDDTLEVHIETTRTVEAFTAGTALKNIPSCRLLEKLGFVLEKTETLSFHKDIRGQDIVFEGGVFVKGRSN